MGRRVAATVFCADYWLYSKVCRTRPRRTRHASRLPYLNNRFAGARQGVRRETAATGVLDNLAGGRKMQEGEQDVVWNSKIVIVNCLFCDPRPNQYYATNSSFVGYLKHIITKYYQIHCDKKVPFLEDFRWESGTDLNMDLSDRVLHRLFLL